jgi:tetratricopeptide (TPR) repeat protein
MIAVERKDFSTAKTFVSQALAHDPNNSYARNLQVQLSKRDGNQTDLMQALNRTVADAPKDAAPLINRAAAHLQAKEFDAADKDISAALALNPTSLQAFETRANIARARGNFEGAIDALTAALAAYPGNGPVLTERAEAYRQLNKFDLALADTEAALKTGLVSPSLRLLRINILIQKGDPPAVATEATQLVSENPSSDFALVAAGKTYAALGMRDKAMSAFDRALALKPYAYIYINRSQVRPESDLQPKLQDLDAALKLEPNQEDALAEKARLLSKAGKHAEAIDLYDRAIKSALDGSYLELGRAIALQRAGRIAEAKTAFDSMRVKAKSAGDFNRMCWAKAINDVLLESALEDCRQAQRMSPDYPGLNGSLGMVLLKLGKLQEARAAFDKAVAAKSDEDAYMGRAIVRSRLGDAAGATADAAEAHRRRPDIDDTFAGYGLRFKDASSASSVAH